jgi:opacity protein-like surface antigen
MGKGGMKIWLAAALLAALALPAAVRAAGPADQVAKGQFQVGIEGSWLGQEKFKDAQERYVFSDDGSGQRTAREVQVRDDYMLSAKLAYGVTDWLSVFARVGRAERGSLRETLGASGEWQAQMKPALVWGLGAQGRVFQLDSGLGLLVGAEYLRYDNRGVGQWRYPDGTSTADYGTSVDSKIDYWRAEANATLYWKLGCLTPYAGLEYSYSELSLDERWFGDGYWSTYAWETKNAENLGAFVGLALEITPALKLDLRGNFISREELLLGVSYAF